MEKRPFVRLNFDANHNGRRVGLEELVQTLRKQILADSHLKGCRLPPVRVLAHQLGVSKNTVQAAYEELKAQTLIESKDRTGLFVAYGTEPVTTCEPVEVPCPELNKPNYLARLRPNPKGVIFLSSVFVDPRLLPKEKLTACLRSILKSPGLPEFYDVQGMPPLREKIADRLRERGMDVDADHIIITNGSQQALDIVTRVLKSKVVATEDPSYYMGKNLMEMNGVKTIGLPIDPFDGIDEAVWQDRLATSKPGLVYLTTNFQNPNGYSYTSHELKRIVQWAREFGFGILEDDWGSDMLSYSEFKPNLRALGGPNVLYMNSFTKKLMPSMRVGYIAANEQTIEALLLAKRVSTIAVPALIESTLFEFLDRGYFDSHLKFIQVELDIRYEFCLSLLREMMPDAVRWTSPGGGPVLWLEVPRQVNLDELVANLKEQGVMVELSSHAYFSTPHAHGFKIGYAYLSQQELEEGVEKASNEIKRQLAAATR